MKVYTKNCSAGSVHKGIRHAVLKDFNVAIAPEKIIKSFSEIITPALQMMYICEKESQKLAELRDWLLPMLMNGQVKVS